MTDVTAPVGVLDSGLGGLSVLRALRQRLPHEDFLYCADCGNAPWGDKSVQWVTERCDEIAHFLVSVHGVKALVLACNTATAAAADHLRTWVPIPVIGIEPAVKPAVQMSRTHCVGVLATAGTIASPRYQSLLTRFADGADVISVGAPNLKRPRLCRSSDATWNRCSKKASIPWCSAARTTPFSRRHCVASSARTSQFWSRATPSRPSLKHDWSIPPD